MNKKNIIFLAGLVLSFLPAISFGKIIFSEIMFDPAGTDGGYEWVEIYNTSQYSVNLEKYKFCEGKPTCHSWKADANNNFTIAGNSYGIITDDFEKFTEKNNFDGLILVSTGFTLTNTGELIQIKNGDGNLDDSLTYNPVSGGGDGQTLSVFDGLWKNSENTAGKINIEKNTKSEDSDGDSENSSSKNEGEKINTSYVEISDMFLGKKKLRAEIDEVGVIMAGARVKFTGTAYGISGVEITGVEFLWNFGDGARDEGQSVYHEYDFPHDYIVTLVVKSGNFTGNTKVRISVIDPALEISYVKIADEKSKGYIKLKNNSGEILNIEDWMLSVDGERFLIPDNTYVDKYSEIIFPQSVTKLIPINGKNKKSRVAILFPNGKKFFSYDWEKELEDFENNKIKEKGFYNKVAAEDYEEENSEQQGSASLEKKGESEVAEKIIVETVKEPVIKKTTKKKSSQKPKEYALPAGAVTHTDYVKSQENLKKEISVREQVLAGAKNIKLAKSESKENKHNDKFSKLLPPKNQSANIISINSSEDFIKDNWPFLTFLGILGTLIGIVMFMRKKEIENLDEEVVEKNELDLIEDGNLVMKKKAEEFEISDISEKK